MSFSTQREVSDGTLTDITLTIEYIEQDDISVLVDDVLIDMTGGSTPYTWEWVTASQLKITPAVPNGIVATVSRSTDIDKMFHEFDAGAVFKDQSVDENFLQLLYLAQEYSEGQGLTDLFSNVDMHGFTFVNLAEPTDLTSPVTLGLFNEAVFDSAFQLRQDLANSSDPLKGSALVNFDGVTLAEFFKSRNLRVVPSISALRGLDKTKYNYAFVAGYYGIGTAGGGLFYLDSADVVTADNAGTIIVNPTDDGRWKRVPNGAVTIEQFGASPSVADNGPSIQAALNWAAGEVVHAGSGVFPVITPIAVDTTGLGEVEGVKLVGAGKKVTIFDNQHTGIMLSISSGPSFTDFQNNILLEHFGIINSLNRAANSGIQLTGLRFGRIAPSITDQGSHGLWLTSVVNDASDCINLDIVDGDYERNGGWGIFIDADLNGIHANLEVTNNRVIENTLGGIWAATCTTSRFARNAIAYNGGDGLNLAKRAGGSFGRNNIVELNEFDSQDDQCVIQGQINTVCNNNYVLANSGVATPMVRGFVITGSIGTRIDKTLTRVAPALTGITLYSIDAGSSNTSIIDTDYSSWVITGNTKYANSSTTTEIIELESLTVSGAWTPIDSSGAGLVFTGVSGRYVRNGNSISITGQLTFPATANAALIAIGGLPFTALTLSPGGLLSSGGAAGDQCAALAGATIIAIYGTTLTRRTNANYSGQTILFSITYILA